VENIIKAAKMKLLRQRQSKNQLKQPNQKENLKSFNKDNIKGKIINQDHCLGKLRKSQKRK